MLLFIINISPITILTEGIKVVKASRLSSESNRMEMPQSPIARRVRGEMMIDRLPRLAAVMLALVLILAAVTLLACEGQIRTSERSTERSTPDSEETSESRAAPLGRLTVVPTSTPRPGAPAAILPVSGRAVLLALYDATCQWRRDNGPLGRRDRVPLM